MHKTSFNTFAATDVLTRPSLKLFTTPGTFKHILCIYDYIVISAFDVTLFSLQLAWWRTYKVFALKRGIACFPKNDFSS